MENKPVGPAKPAAAGDVEDLVSRLHLDGLQYREFSTRRPVALELAGGRAVPTPMPTGVPTQMIAQTFIAPPLVLRPSESPRPVAQEPASAPKVLATPVNSAFERLRRQAIVSRSDAPVISLRLTPRPAVLAAGPKLLRAPLDEVFARLAAAKPLSRY